MFPTRYEDYLFLGINNLPCFFRGNLQRDVNNNSDQANWHENLEIQLCTDGEGYVLLDEKRYSFKKDDIVTVNSNVIHYTATDSRLTYSCLIIDSNFCQMADISHRDFSFDSHFKSKNIVLLFNKISEVYNNADEECRLAKLQMLVLELLIELKINHTISQDRLTVNNNSYETIKQVIKYIRQNYAKTITLTELARKVYTNKYVLSRNFKKITGQTIVQYVNIYRCKKSIELISEGVSVTEAAKLCGYNNMSFYTKTFKKYYGRLPSEFKKQ